MASRRATKQAINRHGSIYLHQDDDTISHCGSISGETFASRRSRTRPAIGGLGGGGGSSMRQHQVDAIAKKLRDYSFDDQDSQVGVDPANGEYQQGKHRSARCNTFFHYYRFLVVMFGGFSVGTMFLLRYNITISILKMVNQTHLYLEEHPDRTIDDMIAAGHTPGGEFNWNNEIQHMIMSWYMVAYTLPQITATKLGNYVGVRLFIPASLSVCAISTLLIPSASYLGWEYVVALRLLNGLGASGVIPLLLTLVENWMRYDEISLGLSLAQVLTCILAASNPLIAGYLSSIHWSHSFYIPGFCTLIFCALWLILITDNPINNRFISEQELKYICESESTSQAIDNSNEKQKPKANSKELECNKQVEVKPNEKEEEEEDEDMDYKPESWKQILRVPSFYAYNLIWAGYCSSYSNFSFILPTYLRQFLKIPIAQNGFYCFIVQAGCIFAVMWPYPLLKLLEGKLKFSISSSRRIGHLVCCAMVAATWMYVGAFHENQLLMLFLNRCFHAGNDIIVTGNLMSNYAKAGISSLVFSMVNSFGNLTIVFASAFIGWMLDHTGQSRFGWWMIFLFLGVMQIVMWLSFVTIPSGPIKFKNSKNKNKNKNRNNSTDLEQAYNKSKVQRSISCQFEQPEDNATVATNKQDDQLAGPIKNNFDKLIKGGPEAKPDLNNNNNNNPAPDQKQSRESRQI